MDSTSRFVSDQEETKEITHYVLNISPGGSGMRYNVTPVSSYEEGMQILRAAAEEWKTRRVGASLDIDRATALELDDFYRYCLAPLTVSVSIETQSPPCSLNVFRESHEALGHAIFNRDGIRIDSRARKVLGGC